MWVARDFNNDLHLFWFKPSRGEYNWEPVNKTDGMEIDCNLFPDLVWEDKSVEVELTPMYKQEILETIGELDKEPKFRKYEIDRRTGKTDNKGL